MKRQILILFFIGITSLFAQNPQCIVYNTSNSALPNNTIRAIAIEKDGIIWIGTENGLVKVDGTNWTVYNSNNSKLPNNYILTIYIDKNNNKWIGTTHGTYAKFDGDTTWNIYNTDNIYPDTDVWSFVEDKVGNIWIGTDAGLAKFDDKDSWVIYNKDNSGLPINEILCLAIDSKNNIWMGGYTEGEDEDGAFTKFDGTNWTVFRNNVPGFSNFYVNDLVIDSLDNIWIELLSSGIIKFDGVSEWSFYNSLNIDERLFTFLNKLLLDKQGNIWIGGLKYLIKFDKDTTWNFYDRNSLGNISLNIWSLAIDLSGNKWIGTEGDGLVLFNEDGVVLGTNKIKQNDFNEIKILPNPAGEEAVISWQLAKQSIANISVYDILGKLVYALDVSQAQHDKNNIQIDVSRFREGVYFVRLSTDESSITRKLIIQHGNQLRIKNYELRIK